MRTRSKFTALTFALLMLGPGAVGAAASESEDTESPSSGVADGRTFGPEDGYSVTTESYPITPGDEPLEVLFGDSLPPETVSPFATWGSSYATSTEYAQFFYVGKARAAGNVFSGERIIKVCIWYSHPGRSSNTVCSSATSNGSTWSAGSEASVSFVDNFSVNWPQTTFHIQTTRINPNIT